MRKLLRIDIFTRLIVFTSMVLFIIAPSLILYYSNRSTQTYENVLPNIIMLGVVLGIGTLAMAKPIVNSIVYFIESLLVLIVEFVDYAPEGINAGIDIQAITVLEIIYCSISIVLTVSIQVYYYRHKKREYTIQEGTNEDTIFDFLNGALSNKKIEDDLEKISDTGEYNVLLKIKKQVIFSRFLRVVSALVSAVIVLIYLLITYLQDGGFILTPFSKIILLLFCSIIVTIIPSLYAPKDSKYVYFFTVIFFLILMTIIAPAYSFSPLFFIIALVINFLAFLVTLIVEGRTWKGAIENK